MANTRLTPPRVAARNISSAGGDDGSTNGGCHGNADGVQPNDKVILAHVKVMVLHWGKFYEQNPNAPVNSYALCRDLVTGPYLNGLAQYGIGRGSMAGSGNINVDPPPATLSEDEARDTLLGWLRNSGNIFAPAIDENSLLYVVFLPPETKPTISSGKDDFCGYHSWAKLHDESKGSDVFYAIIRTDLADKSSGEALIKGVSACVSHEIAEAVASPDGRGYHSATCEIGDLCEQTGTHDYRGWQVEQYWSQGEGKCINGESPVSLRRYYVGGIPGPVHMRVINVEAIASQFR